MLSKSLKSKCSAPPHTWDILILSLFVAFITWNPTFLHGKINIFEVGLYLPGIQSILNGDIPYRDFFHLRGPFELYMPALLMNIFGEHITTLYSYFYFGNVLCLILCVCIAKELIKTRFILYLFTFVLVGRTYPRVVFAIWGGMRYALGLLAVWFVIKFFKSNKTGYIFGAGLVSACALLTSVEMGAYPILGVMVALTISTICQVQDMKTNLKSFGIFVLGLSVIGLPYGIYLAVNSALMPYIESVLTIVTRMQVVIDPHVVSVYPGNFSEALIAMTNVTHTNFKHMTPSYLYIFVLAYLVIRLKRKTCSQEDLMIVCLGVYGFIMYNTGFRGIWAAQFEMALQPEKILLFFLLERTYFYFIAKKSDHINFILDPLNQNSKILKKLQVYGINFLIFAFIMSSVGYSIARYNHRFFAYKFVRSALTGQGTEHLKPLANEEAKALNIERAKGIIVPEEQADELEQMDAFVKNRIAEDEVLFTYPETGTYNFFFDRPFFGNFPLVTFTWFNDRWHQEFMLALNRSKPKYVVVQKGIEQDWKAVYLAREENRKKFHEVLDFISGHYTVERETVLSKIYVLK